MRKKHVHVLLVVAGVAVLAYLFFKQGGAQRVFGQGVTPSATGI